MISWHPDRSEPRIGTTSADQKAVWSHADGCRNPRAQAARQTVQGVRCPRAVSPRAAIRRKAVEPAVSLSRDRAKAFARAFPGRLIARSPFASKSALAQLREGLDPVTERRRGELEAAVTAAMTFPDFADAYIEKMKRERKSAATLEEGNLVPGSAGQGYRAPSDRRDQATRTLGWPQAGGASRSPRNGAAPPGFHRARLSIRDRNIASRSPSCRCFARGADGAPSEASCCASRIAEGGCIAAINRRL